VSVGDQAIWSRSNGREGSAGRCSDGQAERREDRGNYRTLLDIDSEHPFEQPGESLMRAGAGGGDASPGSAEVSWVLSGAFGKPGTGTLPAWRAEDAMISGGSLALGASTPTQWKRMPQASEQ
jgi:hypothetical protein